MRRALFHVKHAAVRPWVEECRVLNASDRGPTSVGAGWEARHYPWRRSHLLKHGETAAIGLDIPQRRKPQAS